MGGLLFSVAFIVVAVVLVARASKRRLQAATQPTTFMIARYDDVASIVRRYRCVCGRRPELVGEDANDDGSTVQLDCVCGRRDRLTFIVGH